MNSFQAGTLQNQGYYKSFQPSFINRNWFVKDMKLLQMLSLADRHLGRLDMFSNYVNIDLYISMHIAMEATQSSKIEGTQTNMEDAFFELDEISIEKRDDLEEVQNYIKATNNAVESLKTLPFSSRLIRQAHGDLLQGVRGMQKLPGVYRTSQNWIGGATLDDAVFVPPVHTQIGDLMSDLEKFANDDMNPLPDLLKIGIIHYQFETIHPFLDGNGRVGRLLIPLYLVSKGILHRPILYLSDFFEKHRSLYFDNLNHVRSQNDINQWLKFFMAGIISTAKKGIETFDGILKLEKSLDSRLKSLKGRERDARKVINALYKRPLISAGEVEEIIEKSNVSAYKLISDMERLKILEEMTGGKRSRLFRFKEYLDLFR